MTSYVFTDKAERDLESIIDYTIEDWGPMQAIGYIDGLEEIAQTLADNPDIGFKRDSLSAGLLSFPYQRYILFYIKKTFGVSIIRVLHASMDSDKHII
jgi:toxin ParE1/3/4